MSLKNQNHNAENLQANVLFIDMNCFFASCEQQVNYWLRNRPVGVCVYTGQYGCVIAPSIEAKKMGIKLGLRLNEAIRICPELVPLETHPQRYREFHIKFINVLKKYSQDVIPKSIDEAVVNLKGYELLYKDTVEVAKAIKADIKKEVGDWMKCSIGIAPNAFLAKLGTEIQKPDGLVLIDAKNIDSILGTLSLTDLPGIAKPMAKRLERGGINNPLELRYASPDTLKRACKSIIGLHWHYRLNFKEVDLIVHPYKNMQAMRQISKDQRECPEQLNELFLALCMTLERRMVRNGIFAKSFGITCNYHDDYAAKHKPESYNDGVSTSQPIQSGVEIMQHLRSRMEKKPSYPVINEYTTTIGVWVMDFIKEEHVQYTLFGSRHKEDKLRKTVYSIKDKFGRDKIMPASELSDEPVLKDTIGFGSIKDMHDEISFFE